MPAIVHPRIAGLVSYPPARLSQKRRTAGFGRGQARESMFIPYPHFSPPNLKKHEKLTIRGYDISSSRSPIEPQSSPRRGADHDIDSTTGVC